VISDVVRLIEDQLSRGARNIDALMLMGELSENKYLFKQINVSQSLLSCLMPPPPDLIEFSVDLVFNDILDRSGLSLASASSTAHLTLTRQRAAGRCDMVLRIKL
jgi:hypothetical protein